MEKTFVFGVLFPTMLTLNITKEDLNLALDQGGLELPGNV